MIVTDLGSQNGTFVNGQRISGARKLSHGDRLTVGDFVLRIVRKVDELPAATPAPSASPSGPPVLERSASPTGPAQKVPASPPQSSAFAPLASPKAAESSLDQEAAKTIHRSLPWSDEGADPSLSLVDGMRVEKEGVIRAAYSENPILDQLRALGALPDADDPSGGFAGGRERSRLDPLALFASVSDLINSAPTPESFLEEVLGLVCMVAQAERGAVVMIDSTGSLKPLCERQMSLGSGSSTAPISRTIVEAAIRERTLITTHDASQDARFGDKQSVALMGLRSVLCAPLVREHEVPAVLYLTRPPGGFSHEEQMAVAAVAQLAGMGLDRSRLHAQMEQEERLRRTLSRFHAPEVVEDVIARSISGEVEMESRMVATEATVIFCDICGFTALAEAISTHELTQMLNAFYHAMTEVIFEQGGTVDKYIGDCVMALFGVPVSHGDDALRAVEAAVQMQLRFARLQETAWAGHPAKLRVGVNTGPLMAGTVGSKLRLEYTALGDAVNVAQRLESIAKPSQILAGPQTAALVRDSYHLYPMKEMAVKGRHAPVEVFEILGRRPKRGDAPSPPALNASADPSLGPAQSTSAVEGEEARNERTMIAPFPKAL